MTIPSKKVGSQALAGLILGLFLAGPVFGDEGVPTPAPSTTEPAPIVKDAIKADKPSKKRGHRKHKKVEKKQVESPSTSNPPAALENSQK